MTTLKKVLPVLLLVAGTAACNSIFGEDKTPKMISYQVLGDAGYPVEVIISKEFVAGVNELGVTEVAVFGSDTLTTVLPIEGDLDVSLERRFFIQVTPLDTLTTLTGRVVVSLDGRGLYNQQGDILRDNPFRFVYVFNQTTTTTIEVF